MTFDFDKYKAIVDYISSSTGKITTSIDKLIAGTIEMRKHSTAAIIRYSTNITEISMGRLSNKIDSSLWLAQGKVALHIQNGARLLFSEKYIFRENSMLPTKLPAEALEILGKQFASRDSVKSLFSRTYSSSVADFSGDEVPNILYFRNHFLTTKGSVLQGPLEVSSEQVTEDNNCMSYRIASKLAGVNKATLIARLQVDQLETNLFIAQQAVTMEAAVEKVDIDSGVSLSGAPSDKSLILRSNIEQVAVKKNLSNIREAIISDKESFSSSDVVTEVYASKGAAEHGIIQEESIKIDAETQPHYSVARIHPSLEYSLAAKPDSTLISGLSDSLYSSRSLDMEKNQIAYGQFTAIVPRVKGEIADEISAEILSDPRGKAAATLKLVFEIVASRLRMENPELFMGNTELSQLNNIKGIIMKPGDTVAFNRRPILKAENNEAASAEDILAKVVHLEKPVLSAKVGKWNF